MAGLLAFAPVVCIDQEAREGCEARRGARAGQQHEGRQPGGRSRHRVAREELRFLGGQVRGIEEEGREADEGCQRVRW
jgi:hypothetical protein